MQIGWLAIQEYLQKVPVVARGGRRHRSISVSGFVGLV